MKIFLSSTCHDLKDLRAELENYLIKNNHKILLSDRATFPIIGGKHRHDVCIENTVLCDLFLIVIDSRYGAPYYRDTSISITWAELRKAIETKKKIIAFIRKDIFNERQTCRHNQKKGNQFEPFFTDNIRTFDLIDEIQQNENGIWIQPFDNSVEIKTRLENLYETKHSVINEKQEQPEINTDLIPITALSGSTASYISNFVTDARTNFLDQHLIEKAIDSIPTFESHLGYPLSIEEIPVSNDYIYYSPIAPLGGKLKWHVKIAPTALGRAVRDELKAILDNLRKRIKR